MKSNRLDKIILGNKLNRPAVDLRWVHRPRLIERLERENLFIVPLDNERLWYRYHHFFQNLAAEHLKNHLSQERRTKVLQLSGRWFSDRGLTEEALRYYLAAGDVDHAVELIDLYLDDAIAVRCNIKGPFERYRHPYFLYRQPSFTPVECF